MSESRLSNTSAVAPGWRRILISGVLANARILCMFQYGVPGKLETFSKIPGDPLYRGHIFLLFLKLLWRLQKKSKRSIILIC